MMHLSLTETFYGLSDIGLVRKNNEDVWKAVPDCHFFMVADGMGGHKAGEIAAKQATELLQASMKDLDKQFRSKGYATDAIIKELKEAVQNVNAKVYNNSLENEELQGMGTTLCCLYFFQGNAFFSHLGDSRIYRFRTDCLKLEQLTVDHSLVNELIELGHLDSKDAVDFPFKNILTKSLGTSPQVEAVVKTLPIQGNEIFLMCTDGLTNYSEFHELENLIKISLQKNLSLKEISEKLILLAKQHGGGDNITVLIVKLENNYDT